MLAVDGSSYVGLGSFTPSKHITVDLYIQTGRTQVEAIEARGA